MQNSDGGIISPTKIKQYLLLISKAIIKITMDFEDTRPLEHSFLQKIYESLMTIAIAVEPIKNSDNLLLAFNGGKDTWIMLHLLHVLFDKSTKNTILHWLSDNGIGKIMANALSYFGVYTLIQFAFLDISELMELKANFKIDKWRYAFFWV